VSSPFFPVVRARRLATRPWVRRAAVAVLALVTGLVVASLVRSGDAARRDWGTTRPVAVATRDLAAGDVLAADAVAVRDLPRALVPAAALAAAPAAGAVVRQPIASGEALVAARLAPDGLQGAAALVPAGHRAVAVPIGPSGAPPLGPGDLVDVLAVVSAAPTSSGESAAALTSVDRPPAFPLVERAAVVAVEDDTVSVGVPEDDAPGVAFALTQGAVVLALAGA
jgi:Flp pilus assembly protein CpaB